MPSQSPTIDSTLVFAVTVCTSECADAVATLNADAEFELKLSTIMDPNITVPVEVYEGSSICIPGCVLPIRRFLFPFETDTNMSPATSDGSEGQLLQLQQTTVVTIVVDMAETGESVDSIQLLNQLKTTRVTLTPPVFLLKGVFLQPRALIHFLHLNQVKTQVTLLLQNLPLTQVKHLL